MPRERSQGQEESWRELADRIIVGSRLFERSARDGEKRETSEPSTDDLHGLAQDGLARAGLDGEARLQ
jgi:hypothetical protein